MKEKIKVASEFRQQKIRASTLGNNTQFVLARVFFFFRLGRETKSKETVSFDFGISNGTTGQGNFSEYKSSLTALNVAALNMINTTQTMLDSIRAFLLGINRSKKHSTIRFACNHKWAIMRIKTAIRIMASVTRSRWIVNTFDTFVVKFRSYF